MDNPGPSGPDLAFFHSFDDSKWWVRAGEEPPKRKDEKDRLRLPQPGEEWTEITAFRGDTVVSYGTTIDFWIMTVVEGIQCHSDTDSVFVDVDEQ